MESYTQFSPRFKMPPSLDGAPPSSGLTRPDGFTLDMPSGDEPGFFPAAAPPAWIPTAAESAVDGRLAGGVAVDGGLPAGSRQTGWGAICPAKPIATPGVGPWGMEHT